GGVARAGAEGEGGGGGAARGRGGEAPRRSGPGDRRQRETGEDQPPAAAGRAREKDEERERADRAPGRVAPAPARREERHGRRQERGRQRALPVVVGPIEGEAEADRGIEGGPEGRRPGAAVLAEPRPAEEDLGRPGEDGGIDDPRRRARVVAAERRESEQERLD